MLIKRDGFPSASLCLNTFRDVDLTTCHIFSLQTTPICSSKIGYPCNPFSTLLGAKEEEEEEEEQKEEGKEEGRRRKREWSRRVKEAGRRRRGRRGRGKGIQPLQIEGCLLSGKTWASCKYAFI